MLPRTVPFPLALGLTLALAVSAPPAQPQCATPQLWTYPASLQGPVSAVASDAGFGAGLSFFTVANRVYAVWNETTAGAGGHTRGTLKWETPVGSSDLSPPVPVSLTPGTGEFVFVAGHDGYLYKLDAVTGAVVTPVDTRRAVGSVLACATDQIVAAPTVQLYALSDTVFRTNVIASGGSHAPNDDVVFVVTHNQCGDHTHNRVLAHWASNVRLKWTFNANTDNSPGSSPYNVDAGEESVALDYSSNSLLLGTDQQGGAGQMTVWNLNSTTGARRWAYNAGPVLNRPRAGGARFYVAAANGTLYSLKPDPMIAFQGIPIWTQAVTASGIHRNPWVEFRPPQNNILLVTGDDGRVYRFDDLGASATPVWSTPAGPVYTGMAALFPTAGKVYLGRNDGTVQQLNSGSGAVEATESTGVQLGVGNLTRDFSASASQLDRLLVPAGNGVAQRYCVPWAAPSGIPMPRAGVSGGLELFPNPIRNETEIQFMLKVGGRVSLAVFDAGGRRVRALLDGPQQAGAHQVQWDGRGLDGRSVPAGTYLVRLEIGGRARTQKAVIVR